ncbi:MAG: hypothetical protein M3Z04_06755, partial [Chloroflexota bacterium]|nr:hypothetical protein [Chloroflexota bacterium]
MGADIKRSPGATYWADWQYTPDEWQHFNQLEQRHTWRLAAQQIGLGVTVALPLGIVEGFFGFSNNDSQNSIVIGLGVLSCFFGFMLLMGLGRALRKYSFGQELQIARRQGSRAIRISPKAICMGSREFLLIGGYKPRELVSVTLRLSQPAVLQFATIAAKRTLSEWRYDIWVPVPAGHEAE